MSQGTPWCPAPTITRNQGHVRPTAHPQAPLPSQHLPALKEGHGARTESFTHCTASFTSSRALSDAGPAPPLAVVLCQPIAPPALPLLLPPLPTPDSIPDAPLSSPGLARRAPAHPPPQSCLSFRKDASPAFILFIYLFESPESYTIILNVSICESVALTPHSAPAPSSLQEAPASSALPWDVSAIVLVAKGAACSCFQPQDPIPEPALEAIPHGGMHVPVVPQAPLAPPLCTRPTRASHNESWSLSSK